MQGVARFRSSLQRRPCKKRIGNVTGNFPSCSTGSEGVSGQLSWIKASCIWSREVLSIVELHKGFCQASVLRSSTEVAVLVAVDVCVVVSVVVVVSVFVMVFVVVVFVVVVIVVVVTVTVVLVVWVIFVTDVVEIGTVGAFPFS